jgi:hypothetical protein
MKKRRRFKQKLSFFQRCYNEAERLRLVTRTCPARSLPY